MLSLPTSLHCINNKSLLPKYKISETLKGVGGENFQKGIAGFWRYLNPSFLKNKDYYKEYRPTSVIVEALFKLMPQVVLREHKLTDHLFASIRVNLAYCDKNARS